LPASETSSSGAPREAIRSQPSPASATAPGPDLEEHEDDETEGQRQPRGLHALGDGARPVTGTRAAGRPGGRAVGEEVQQRRRPGEQPAADGEAAEGDGTQMPDDSGVDQQVERLGREDDERRNGEREDGGAAGHSPVSSLRKASMVFSRSR
jgi:hypothetical protein